MEVRFLNVAKDVLRSATVGEGWLTSGKTYHVASIEARRDGAVEYRLVSDDGVTPGLFRAEYFEIVSNDLPVNWSISFDADGNLDIAPESWLVTGF